MTQPNPVVVKALQQALVDLTDLSLQAKPGPLEHCRLRLPFPTPAPRRDRRRGSPSRRRRCRAYDCHPGHPGRRAATVAADSQVEPIDGGVLPTDKATVMIQERLEGVANRIKATLDEVDEYDHLSNDMLIAIATGLEKHAWMLRVSAEEQA